MIGQINYIPKNKSLDTHQINGVNWLYKTKGNLFLCDDMGLGKTVTIICYLNKIRCKKVLIVCKAKGISVWTEHLANWHLQNPVVTIFHPSTPLFETDILIASYNWFSNPLSARAIRDTFPYKVCILDEIHTIRKGSSQRGRKLFAKNGICAKAKKVISLTGTPLFNRVIGMYPMLRGLRPDVIPDMNRHDFGMRYCGGYMRNGEWNYQGASNLSELKNKLLDTCMLRHRHSNDKMPLLDNPKILYLSPTISSNVLAGQMTFDSNFKPSHAMHNPQGNEIATLRRKVGMEKISAITAYVEVILSLSYARRVLIFAYHKAVISELRDELQFYKTASLTGASSPIKATQVIKDFQNHKLQILIASVSAFGDSITLTAATDLLFAEISYIWKENLQAIKRVHRRGRTASVCPVFFINKNSFDERILKINLDKLKAGLQFS